MAKTVAKSDVFAKIGAKANKAFTSAKSKEVKLPGGGNLPAGIDGGVAKLVSMEFSEYKKGDNKGKPFFMAQAVVVNPDGSTRPWIVELPNGTKFKASGLQTKFGPEPLCDTPAKKGQTPGKNARLTFEDHMDHVVNCFKLLAGKEAVEDLTDASELKELGDALIENGCYFSFRTWSIPKKKKGEPGYNEKYDSPTAPPPRVFETWSEAMADFASEDSSGEEVEDEEETEEEVDETEEEVEEVTPKKGKAKKAAEPEEEEETEEEVEEEEEESEEEESEEDDGLDALAEEADKEKLTPAVKKARKELSDKAVEAGYDLAEVKAADTFADVVEMIRNPKEEESEDGEEPGEDEEEASEEEGESEGEEDEESAPEVGSEYQYKPKGAKKAIDVEVTKINESKGLAYAKDSATKKVILGPDKKPLGIKFAELLSE